MADDYAFDGEWKSLPSATKPKFGLGAAFVENKLHFLGGFSEETTEDGTLAYEGFDLQTNLWDSQRLNCANVEDRAGHACVSVKSLIYIFGGESRDKERRILGDMYVCDTAGDKEFKLVTIPKEPVEEEVIAVEKKKEKKKPKPAPPKSKKEEKGKGKKAKGKGKGKDQKGKGKDAKASKAAKPKASKPDAKSSEKKPEKKKGKKGDDVPEAPAWPSARRWTSACAINESRWLMFGGQAADNTLLNDLWIFDTVAGTWTVLPETEDGMPAARAHHTVSYVESSGLVVLYGGHDGSKMCSDVWVYHIETGVWSCFDKAAGGANNPGARIWHATAIFDQEAPSLEDAQDDSADASTSGQKDTAGGEDPDGISATDQQETSGGPRLVLFGGIGRTGLADREVYTLDLSTGEWVKLQLESADTVAGVPTDTDVGPTARHGCTILKRSARELLVLGGSVGGAEVWAIDTDMESIIARRKAEAAKAARANFGSVTYANGDYYEGCWKDSKRHGQGTCKYANGDVYVGLWEQDMRNGQGVCTYANGDVYEGFWEDNQRCEHGKIVYADGGPFHIGEASYDGNWVRDKRNGTGSAVYTDGRRYSGQWLDDRRHGQGSIVNPDRSKYTGTWANDKRHGDGFFGNANGDDYTGQFADDVFSGNGVMVYADGTTYEGAWANGRRNGVGRCAYANKNVYQGKWLGDQRSGKGVITCANGDRYEGLWFKGNRHDHGVCTYSDGSVYTGSWIEGKRSGSGQLKHPHGTLYRGNWKRGFQSGAGECSYFDETKQAIGDYKGEYLLGVRAGHGVMTYADGSVYDGQWKEDNRNGRGTLSTIAGSRYVGEWKDDLRDGAGESTWQASGPCLEVISFTYYNGQWVKDLQNGKGNAILTNGDKYNGDWNDGKQDGTGVNEYINGDRFEGAFSGGLPHGEGVMTRADGSVMQCVFTHGIVS